MQLQAPPLSDVPAVQELLFSKACLHLSERVAPKARSRLAFDLVNKAMPALPSSGGLIRREDIEALTPRFMKSVELTNDAIHEELDRIGFGRDGIEKAADPLSGFKVTWLDCFGIHETYVVPVEALRAYCAAANDPVPSDLELQTVMKSVPRPSRIGSTADWVRAAIKKLGDDRKDARRLTW